ncbi:MAG: MFS transporter, partial [Candidatus Omnitrophota bacterium]|nr:MFS transporter [Candidatus Omnitrophota bacterium]
LSYGTAALIYGPLARAVDAKKIILICLFLFSCANFLAGISPNIKSLFAARFFMGAFGAAFIPLALILIARGTAPDRRGRYVGSFFGATFFASLLGLFLSGIIPWRLIYLIPASAGFILCLFVYFYLPHFSQGKSQLRINYLPALRDRRVLVVFTYIFFISLLYHGVQQWLGVYFSKQYQLSQFIISMLITLTSFSGIFGELLGGWFSDFLGRVKTIDLGISLMILSVFLLIFHLPLLILYLLMVAWGLGWTFNHSGLSTLLTDLPKEFLNESASLNSSVRFLAGGVGAFLGGVLLQRSFILGFTVFGICLLLLLIFSKQLIIKKE